MDALEELRRLYRDRESIARGKHRAGEKIVGYFSDNIPVELVLAAGAFPVQLFGDPADTTEIGDRYMEEFSDGNIRSIFDRMLRGHYDFADLVVVPRTSESYLQLYYYLLEARKWEPARPFPELYLFDLLQAPGATVARYDRGRLGDLRAKLGGATEIGLSQAIRLVNENRTLLGEVNRLRRRDPPRLSGTDMLRVAGTSGVMDREAHSAALRKILAGAGALRPLPGKRLMVKGSPHDDDGFYGLVESCGAVVVADDHLSGERVFEHRVAEGDDGMAALTEHYHRHSPSLRSYPQEEQDRRFLDLVGEASVQGVIFFHDEWDDVLGWDYPAQKKMLDARGIPSVFLKKQSYRAPDRAAQREAVMALIGSIT